MSGNDIEIDGISIEAIVRAVPHAREIGMKLERVEAGRIIMSLPYDERLIGNPETGVLHGGVITTLVDMACGMAVWSSLDEMAPIATLDLRIDYLHPAVPGKTLFADGVCYKKTRNIAFARGIAYHDDPDDPVATTAAAFMINSAGTVPQARDAARLLEEAENA